MSIEQELSIVRDNIAEYGMTNITQLEYDAIYQQGRADANKDIEPMIREIHDCVYNEGFIKGVDEGILKCIKAIENEYGVHSDTTFNVSHILEQLRD